MRLFFALVAMSMIPISVHGTECEMEEVGIFNDTDDASTIVKRPIFRGDAGRVSTFYVTRLRVNTDGARTSYHPDDPSGNKGLAINLLANGISVKRNGQRVSSAKEKVEIFQKVRENDWRQVPDYKLSMASVMKKDVGKSDSSRFVPCIDDNGYLVSMTSFKREPETTELRDTCRGDYYFDAVDTAHFVLPGGDGLRLLNRNAPAGWRLSPGDVGVFYYPSTNQLVYAIAADVGPADKLGEGSVNLDFRLKCQGKNAPSSCLSSPQDYKTYGKVNGVDGVLSLDIPEGVRALVFPRSTPRIDFDQISSRLDYPITDEKFAAYAEKLFFKWGGGTRQQAVDRLKACGELATTRQRELN